MNKPYSTSIIKETRTSTPLDVGNNTLGTRHFTTITERQDWHNTPANGKYAGKSYKITSHYVGPTEGQLHTLLNTRSEPWAD